MSTHFWQKIGLVLLGFAIAALMLELVLRTAGGLMLYQQERSNRHRLVDNEGVRILCLGESTTAGGHPYGLTSYPGFLEQVLNERKPEKKYAVINEGIIGAKTDAIISRLNENLSMYQPDIVVVMMGINDLRTDIVQYKEHDIWALLRRSRVYKLIHLLGVHMREKRKELQRFPGSIKKAYHLLCSNNLDAAEEILLQIIEKEPENSWAYHLLAEVHAHREMANPDTENVCLAEKWYLKALELDPHNIGAYFDLGFHYNRKNNVEKLRELLPKFLLLNYENNDEGVLPYVVAWDLKVNDGQISETLIKKSWNERMADFFFDMLAQVYEYRGYTKLARQCNDLAQEWRDAHGFVNMENNYQLLRDMVLGRDMTLVCVQYPMRNVENLKEVIGERENVFFVDNEERFRDKVRSEGYSAYFIDTFAGNFGHCTEKGYVLLAYNVAEVILGMGSHSEAL